MQPVSLSSCNFRHLIIRQKRFVWHAVPTFIFTAVNVAPRPQRFLSKHTVEDCLCTSSKCCMFFMHHCKFCMAIVLYFGRPEYSMTTLATNQRKLFIVSTATATPTPHDHQSHSTYTPSPHDHPATLNVHPHHTTTQSHSMYTLTTRPPSHTQCTPSPHDHPVTLNVHPHHTTTQSHSMYTHTTRPPSHTQCTPSPHDHPATLNVHPHHTTTQSHSMYTHTTLFNTYEWNSSLYINKRTILSQKFQKLKSLNLKIDNDSLNTETN